MASYKVVKRRKMNVKNEECEDDLVSVKYVYILKTLKRYLISII